MDLYLLNDQLQREEVVEGYESLIWTERYTAWGDFELKVPSTPIARNIFRADRFLCMSESTYVMKIETVIDNYDDEGRRILEISGRTIESLLDDRAAMPAIDDLTTTPKWELTGTPGNIAREMFETICVDHVLSAADAFPFYTAGTILPSGNIPEPDDVVTILFDPDTLYGSLKKLCDLYNLGFRIVRNGDTSELYFEIYTGSNRTASQTVYPAIIFSRALDNLANTAVLMSTAQIKNVAYVFAKNGSATVYSVGADTTATGFERRVLVVNANDIDTAAGLELDSQLAQRGLEELWKHRKIYQFDGEISQYNPLKYGVDYNLGDLVEQQDETGFGNLVIVTEQIFVQDSEGFRSYPTLSLYETLVPGTWAKWDPPDEEWVEVSPTIVWGSL